MTNVIHLPRPMALRTAAPRLGHYLRVGRNEHKEIAYLLAEGERRYSGIVIDGHLAERHKELKTEAEKLGLETILDPKTHATAFEGGFTDSLGELPWIGGKQSTLGDFIGSEGCRRAEQIAEFAAFNRFSAVLAPAHLVASANDPWLKADVHVAQHLRKDLDPSVALFFPLALPLSVLRDPSSRAIILNELRGLEMDALWLRVENYGNDASGEKVRSFIECVTHFHELNVPIVADFVAGIPALSPLAFGAVGGISHGVMVFESFRANHWKKPAEGNPRTPSHRVYFHELDLLLAPSQAQALLAQSTRIRGQHGCRDPQCCPKGPRDMFDHPVRHYLRQRAGEVASIGSVPQAGRITFLMDSLVRPRSDAMAALTGAGLTDNKLAVKIANKNKTLARVRTSLANLAESFSPPSSTRVPLMPGQRSA